MGLYTDRAKKKEQELNKALGKTMVYRPTGVSKDTPSMPSSNVMPTGTAPKTLPMAATSIADKIKIANEKASRYYAQNGADMSDNTPKTIGPQQWNGGNTKGITLAPGTSMAKRAATAAEKASTAYQNAFLPTAKTTAKTTYGPQQWNGGTDNVNPYTPNKKTPSVFQTTMENARNMEMPATPMKMRQGTSLYDRVYNALASIGDSRIGSDLSLKAVTKQSVINENDYRKILSEYDRLINQLILERNKYTANDTNYRKYNAMIDQVYKMADSVRDRTADMTEANKFLSNAGTLQSKATEGMGAVGKNITESAISVGDNLATMALTGFNPTATLIAMGVGAAGQRANELSNAGVAANSAFGRGVLSGVIEGLTEKIGIDNLYSIIKSDNVRLLSDILRQAASEGTEEGLSSILNYAADRMAGDKHDFDWDDMAQSVIQGALSGVLFGVGGIATNKVKNIISEHNKYLPSAASSIEMPKIEVLPDGTKPYSSDISNTNVNIDGMTASEYLDFYNKSQQYANNSEQSRYMKQIYDVMTGKAGEMDTVVLGNTPDILQKYGAKNIEMTMKPSAVRKIAYPTNYLGVKQGHNLGFYALEQLPQQLANPVAIAKSKMPNSLIVFTEFLDADNSPVIAAIHLDKNGNIGVSNEVASVYGKRTFDNMVSDLRNSGKMLYEDKNRGLASLPADGLRLSAVEATTDPIFNIYDSLQNYNTNSEKNKNILPMPQDNMMPMPGEAYQGRMQTANADIAIPINNNEAKSVIKIDMTEAEREPILRNANVNVSDATRYAPPQDIIKEIKSGNYKGAYKAIKQYAKDIRLFNDAYRNENVEIDFNFSNESYKKSVHEQGARKNDLTNFLYMVNDLRSIVTNAVPIEIHSDRIKNGALKSTRVLASAFWNGESVVPVEITIKEYLQDDAQPKLYMAVTINKEGDTVKTGSPLQGPPIIASPSTISLTDLVKGVNSNNMDFLKYFPDSMLSSEQIGYKKTALEKERVKYAEKNNITDNNAFPTNRENAMTGEDTSRSADSLGIVNQDAQKLFEDMQNAKAGAKDKFRKAYQYSISGWAPFERMTKADTRTDGRNITGLVNKTAQKGGVYDTIKTKGLFDINGNKVNDLSLDEVVKQVPKNQINDFNTYWHELHNIDRQAQGKPVTEHTADESRKIVAQYEAQHPEFVKYRENISKYFDTFMRTWAVDTGLISKDNYNELRKMYPYYIPTYRVLDDGNISSGGTSYRTGRRIQNRNAIGKAKGGTSEVLSFDEAIAYKMNTVVNAAIKNDISREIFSFAQALPMEAAKNGILIQDNANSKNTTQLDLDSFTDMLDRNIARETSKGNYEITFYNEGKPQTMKISKDVWEAYNFLDDKLGGAGYRILADIGRKVTAPMKAATTGYNPLFALTNIIRDAQTYAINNSAKNGAQAARNYAKAFKEIRKGSDTYDQYRALGGSQNGYYGSDMYNNTYKPKTNFQKAADALKKPFDIISGLGEFTEKLPRYAEYLNTIDNLGNTDAGRLQASLNAADVTVNFGRTSQLSALANAWVPYFNAGLQGMDRTFRQIGAHPVKTGIRAVATVFLPTLLLWLVNKDNPHWEDVKDGVRDNYYLLPNLLGPRDENGYCETFIRIPKSREFGALFSASFERFLRAYNESEETGKDIKETLPTAFDGYGDTVLNSFMPPDILGDNIIGSIRRLDTNTAWHGGKIVPSNYEDLSPQYQYDINTSGVAMKAAELAQRLPFAFEATKSPMKMDYLIDSYGGYWGDLLQGLTSRKNVGSTDKETVLNSLNSGIIQPFKNRFTTDSAYSNYNLDRFYDRKGEVTTAAADRNYAENLPSDYKTPEEKLSSDFTEAQSKISELTKQEKAILESGMTIAEKNAKIRELKQQKNEIAKNMLTSQDELYANYKREYIPEISDLNDDRQAQAKDLNKRYGLEYKDFHKIYDKYRELNNDDTLSATMKETRLDEYLKSQGYTDEYYITDELKHDFSYFNQSPATSYYDTESYQLVEPFMDVDVYNDIKNVLSDVEYPAKTKGAKSLAYKSAIDEFLEEYGYDPTYNQRMEIYEAFGVGKSYRY